MQKNVIDFYCVYAGHRVILHASVYQHVASKSCVDDAETSIIGDVARCRRVLTEHSGRHQASSATCTRRRFRPLTLLLRQQVHLSDGDASDNARSCSSWSGDSCRRRQQQPPHHSSFARALQTTLIPENAGSSSKMGVHEKTSELLYRLSIKLQ